MASSDLRANKDIVQIAVEADGLALQFASIELRKDEEVVSAAVAQNPKAKKYAWKEPTEDGMSEHPAGTPLDGVKGVSYDPIKEGELLEREAKHEASVKAAKKKRESEMRAKAEEKKLKIEAVKMRQKELQKAEFYRQLGVEKKHNSEKERAIAQRDEAMEEKRPQKKLASFRARQDSKLQLDEIPEKVPPVQKPAAKKAKIKNEVRQAVFFLINYEALPVSDLKFSSSRDVLLLDIFIHYRAI